MKYILRILVFSGLLGCAAVKAQQVKIIHFDDLEAYTQAENDTLYILNFWATWCRPCVAEMPYFEQVAQENESRPVKLVFISLDFPENLEDKVIPFLKRKKYTSEVVLLDEPKYNEWIDKVSPEWSGAIPATLFVNANQEIREFHEGDYDYETLSEKVNSLLTE